MKDLQYIIDKQIELNKGVNFFHNNKTVLKFTQESIQIVTHIDENCKWQIESLIDHIVDKVLNEFYRINQYYNFDAEAIKRLRNIYIRLFDNIKNKYLPTNELIEHHYQNLRQWLKSTNPFAEKIYSREEEKLKAVSCFEYSPELQIDILQINISEIIEPILDIGCGKEGNMVRYLRTNGLDAFGIDRYTSNYTYIDNADWIGYDYGQKKWGTIISNLGFTNHFMHHHLREDGNYKEYAIRYMQILQSLKQGGSFHYAPALPFIELYLDMNTYRIRRKQLGQKNLESVIIKYIG